MKSKIIILILLAAIVAGAFYILTTDNHAIEFKDGQILDKRSPDEKLFYDLSMMHALVNSIDITGSHAKISLAYQGDSQNLLKDYAAMNLVTIENAPWTETVTINFEKGPKLTTNAGDTLALYAGEIDAKQYVDTIISGTEKGATEKKAKPEPIVEKSNSLNSETSADCTDSRKAYQGYIDAYNKMTDLMAEGRGETQEAKDAYKSYKEKKACYEERINK